MPEIKSIKAQKKAVTVSVGDETLTCYYLPSKYTRQWVKDFDAKAKAIQAKVEKGKPVSDDEQAADVQMVVDLLDSWDLTDEGTPCPITVEFLLDVLGYVTSGRILQAIWTDINPNAPKA